MADSEKKKIIKVGTTVPYERWVSRSIESLGEDRQAAILRAREHAETLKHRGWWSKSLIGIVVLINVVSLFLVIALGYDWISYEAEYAVPAVIAANFAETWALTKIAMKFYFTVDQKKNA